jgi:hypothetical protein
MSRKNKNLRAVSITQLQRLAEKQYSAKHRYCHEMALGNAPCWSELHPFEVLRDFISDLTGEGFQQWKELRYPDNPDNAKLASKENLYRFRHKLGGVDGDLDN